MPQVLLVLNEVAASVLDNRPNIAVGTRTFLLKFSDDQVARTSVNFASVMHTVKTLQTAYQQLNIFALFITKNIAKYCFFDRVYNTIKTTV